MLENFKNLSQVDRRNQIVLCLKKEGNVRVSELSDLFSTSEVTIRNDLAELENAGVLQRVHGGAIQTVKNYYALDASQRINARKEEKIQIAALVSDLIQDGENIIMNSGSTNYFIAQELSQKTNLRIITNSIQVSQAFSANPSHEVILLGGIFNDQYLFTYGDDTLQQLKKYKVDKTILSADGIDLESGITTYHNEVASLCSLMLRRASLSIVAADHTKLGHTAFSRVEGLEIIDYLVTDEKSEGFDFETYQEFDMEILTPNHNKKLEI